MKIKTLSLFCFLCLSVLIILGSCATSQNPDKMVFERFCGTWANEDYEPEPGTSKPMFARVIINPDGTMLAYQNLYETGSTLPATYTVEKRWSNSGGDSFYHVNVHLPMLEGTRYELWRIDKYNSVWEVQWSNIDYPEEIDPEDLRSSYHIHYRY